jgi:hypothetical protein
LKAAIFDNNVRQLTVRLSPGIKGMPAVVLGRVEANDDKGFETRIKEAITRFGITDPMRRMG